jgi:hypothetical protein
MDLRQLFKIKKKESLLEKVLNEKIEIIQNKIKVEKAAVKKREMYIENLQRDSDLQLEEISDYELQLRQLEEEKELLRLHLE